ncbi:hypothetical protein [Gordonia aichiensis]|uniref:hypothetical protein n=1 Tax=Gordonia aichiensis TaxID=36820 RepID=UPI003262F06F
MRQRGIATLHEGGVDAGREHRVDRPLSGDGLRGDLKLFEDIGVGAAVGEELAQCVDSFGPELGSVFAA